MKSTFRYLLLSTVIITAGITTTTYGESKVGFFSNLFGSSDSNKNDDSKDKSSVKDENNKAKKDNNKQDKKADDTTTKDKKETKDTNKAITDGDNNSSDNTKNAEDIKHEPEQQKQDDKENEQIKDESHVAVKFKDGTVINKGTVLKDLGEIGGQYQQKMSFNDLMTFLSLKYAYEKVITDEAKKAKLDEGEDFKKSLANREKALCTFSFLEEQADKLMTQKEIKKFYDDTWDKHIKGTNQVSLILIQAPSKAVAEQIKKEVKTEKDLEKTIKNLKDKNNNVGTIPLDDYPETALPPEIIKEMKTKGANAIIGPFPIQGAFTLFFVKSFHKAKKKELSDDMLPQIKTLASKEFANRYISSLIEKHKVEMYDLNGDKLDWSNKGKKDKKSKPVPMLSKIKETQVIAKIGDKQTLTMQDLYKMFNIKSLDNEVFGSLAMQLRISIEDVIQNAIKLCVQDKLLSLEVDSANYMNTDKMKKLREQVAKQHLRNAYFAKTVRITESDAKKEYNKYIKMIKPEEKDDNEISVKLMFYKSKTDAEAAIKEYKSKPQKLKEDLKARIADKKNAIDAGYIKRQDVPQELWNVIKKCTTGTCVPQALQIDGTLYGFEGNNFAIAYIGDRRPIKLPTFQETSQMFRKVAEKMQAIAICDELLLNNVTSIGGKSYKSLPEEMRHKLLVAIIQFDNRAELSSSND